MKRLLFFVSMIIFAGTIQAQDRWTVQLNSKVLLAAKTEDTTLNKVSVKNLKKGSLIVTYTPGKATNERKRRIMVYDVNEQELYSKDAYSIAIPAASLKKWRLATPQIKIYTIPVLGAEGANVRLRRVHLCTIKFE